MRKYMIHQKMLAMQGGETTNTASGNGGTAKLVKDIAEMHNVIKECNKEVLALKKRKWFVHGSKKLKKIDLKIK